MLFWRRAEGKHLAAAVSQFRVDEMGHAKTVSVNLKLRSHSPERHSSVITAVRMRVGEFEILL